MSTGRTAAGFVEDARTQIATLTLEEARGRLDGGATFLDVREPEEWRSGHVQGAVHVPRGVLEFKIENTLPDKAQPIVTYCATGGRSALAAARLREMGYLDVAALGVGFEEWAKAGYPAGKD